MSITMQNKETIRNNMATLLNKYNYDYEHYALDKIIDTWATNKAKLIELLSKHPNYVEGEFLIAFNQDFNRDVDESGANRFASWIYENAEFIRENMPEELKQIRARELRDSGYSEDFYNSYYPLTFCLGFLTSRPYLYAHQFINEEMATAFNAISSSLRIKAGQKTSRAINKLCTYLGINKHPDYNKEFAKFADSVNPLKVVRHTIISVNPIDYLTMSFGNSWASCHTIDKENMRDMPNAYEGQYSSGTISYMLDEVSIVFYTVDAAYDGNKYYFQDKINRCMFHYGENKLIQGRVYPQDNDNDDSGIYKDIREIMQKVIADCEGVDNYWTTKRGTETINRYVHSKGTHYRDYLSYDNCRISFPKDREDDGACMTIGHPPICVECGCAHDYTDNINCCSGKYVCAHCGDTIRSSDDVYWVGDEPYCRDCVTYCDWCNEYHVADEVHWVESESMNVCEDCLEDHFIHCDHCGDDYRIENTTYLEHYERDVCEDCLNNYYTRCDICGEYYRDNEITYDEATEQNYCPDCYEEKEENEEDEE